MSRHAWLLLLPLSLPIFGELEQHLHEGEVLYRGGAFRRAVEHYEHAYPEATTQAEQETLLFNAATCLAADAAYPEAEQRLTALRATTEDSTLQAKSSYNLGTCLVRSAMEAESSDPETAVRRYHSAIAAFRSALHAGEHMPDAAHNLELAMMRVTRLQDEGRQEEENSEETDDHDSGTPGDEEGEEMEEFDDASDYDEEAELFDPGEPLGEFSEYEEVRGLPPPNQNEMEILAEELQNQQQRKKKSGAYRGVERDW